MLENLHPKTLIAIVGPTAVGKTSLAVQLAQKLSTEIISADSRQIYREMTVGTAKPTVSELSIIPHHFINSHSIHQAYSAGDYEEEALRTLNNLFKKHNIVIAVGGSGLFVRALTEGLDNLPKAPVEIREQLNIEYKNFGLEILRSRLRNIDPINFDKIDNLNPQRVIRALEVYDTSGKPISHFLNHEKKSRNFKTLTIGLNTNRSVLYDRINRRVDSMMEQGLLEEVRDLYDFRSLSPLLSVGYTELFNHLENKTPLDKAIDDIKQNSRRYAKRQITWFKKYGNTHWFQPEDVDEINCFITTSINN